jgi:hypothetical protein
MYIWRYYYSSVSKWKLHTDKNYNRIEMLLINHLSNRWYVIRRSSYDALSLAPSFRWSLSPQFHSQVPGEIGRPMTAIREIFPALLYFQWVPRNVIKPELWYILFSAVRVHFFRLLIFAVHFFSPWSAPRDALPTYFYSTSCACVIIHVRLTGVIMVTRPWVTKNRMDCSSAESTLKGSGHVQDQHFSANHWHQNIADTSLQMKT